MSSRATRKNLEAMDRIISALERRVHELERQKDGAYSERDKCVSLIAEMAHALGLNVGLGQHPSEDENWDNDWRTIVFIDLPSGQVSWHIHDSERPWFQWLTEYGGKWDGHSTEEKYRRVLEPGDLVSPWRQE